MTRQVPRLLLMLVLATCCVVTASAETSKLDARARVALAQLRAGSTTASLKTAGQAVNDEGELDVFIVGSVTRAQLEGAGAIVRSEVNDIFTAYIPASAVDAVAALPGVRSIEAAAIVEPELEISVPSTGATALRGLGPNFTGLNGTGVLVGDVDTGVDFDHDDFKDPGGNTRLINIWDQTDLTGPNPAGFAYGTEWSQAQIQAHTSIERDTVGHGTHCMGIMGGDGSGTGGAVPAFTYVGMAPKATLLMVKTNFSTTGVFDGVNYFFQRAAALGMNAVCNLSLGSQYGPHDGSSAFESGLSSIVGPGKIVCVSAGNDRGVARHAFTNATVAGANVTMSITGMNGGGRTVAISGYYDASETELITVKTPNGTIIGPIALGLSNAAYPGPLTGNGQVYVENGITVYPSGAREVYIEINTPTGQNGAGTWTITATAVVLGATNGRTDFWRFFNNSTSANFVTGNQNNQYLLSEPANAAGVVTVAAYATRKSWTDCNGFSLSFSGSVAAGNLATFSSPGPTRDNRNKPDICAPGTAIASATSFDITQTCAVSGSLNLADGMMHTINQGTSMAAPHVTGASALLMQKFGAVTPAFIKGYLNTHAIVDGATGTPWNRDWGGGKLFLGDLVNPLVTVTSPNGGEVLTVGNNTNLTWSASDNVGVTSVDLYLSRAGVGGPFETIATGQPNSGSYAWVVTGPTTNNAYLKVVANDANANTGTDLSDQNFTIDSPVPVLMSLLEATSEGSAVVLRYQFALAGTRVVRVERSDVAGGNFVAVPVEFGTDGDVSLAIDRSTLPGATYYYRLVAREPSGAEVTAGPITATVENTIKAFALSKIAPNPVGAAPMRVEFSVPREANIRVLMVDVRGRIVSTLASGRYMPGVYSVSWNHAAEGRVGAGLYFVHFLTPDGNRTARVIVTE